jgi:hypothetical protein
VVLLLLAAVVVIIVIVRRRWRRRWSRIVAAPRSGELRRAVPVVVIIIAAAGRLVSAARLSAAASASRGVVAVVAAGATATIPARRTRATAATSLEAERRLRPIDLGRWSLLDATLYLRSVDRLRGVLRRLFLWWFEGHWANAIDALDDEICDAEGDRKPLRQSHGTGKLMSVECSHTGYAHCVMNVKQ